LRCVWLIAPDERGKIFLLTTVAECRPQPSSVNERDVKVHPNR
jgi:hypothetical protein